MGNKYAYVLVLLYIQFLSLPNRKKVATVSKRNKAYQANIPPLIHTFIHTYIRIMSAHNLAMAKQETNRRLMRCRLKSLSSDDNKGLKW